MPLRSDEELMEAVKKGDFKAFSILFNRYSQKISNLSFRFSGQKDFAEEIVQETFIRIWEKADLFKKGYRFSSWIYRIALNLCINQKKETNIFQSLNTNDDVEIELPTGEKDISEQLIIKEEYEMLQAALMKLPDKQRMALLLAREEGYSYIEIGKLLGLSISSVESLIYRARKKLIEMLSGKIEGL